MTEKLAILEERVQETVDQVKHTFDVHYQVGQRPWLMLGASVLIGYTLGQHGGVCRAMANGINGAAGHAEPQQSGGALASINAALSSAVIGVLWAMAKQVLLPASRVIDSVSAKAAVRPVR